MLQAAPSASSGRGDLVIQPAYFTSSLFVNTLREDIQQLVQAYTEAHANEIHLANSGPPNHTLKPFVLFKDLWTRLGWNWLHLKILEPRARETFINVVFRLFLECSVSAETPTGRAVGVFGLYVFYMTQPSTSTLQVRSVTGVPISLDIYESFLRLPTLLCDSEAHRPLKLHVLYAMKALGSTFLILPPSTLQSQNPRELPREIIQQVGSGDIFETPMLPSGSTKRKTGRPSKAEKAQRARSAIVGLNKWLDKSSYPVTDMPKDPAGAPIDDDPPEEDMFMFDSEGRPVTPTTHIMLSQRPTASLQMYRARKAELMRNVEGTEPLVRASSRLQTRLKEIGAMTSERGVEAGAEGDRLSGLLRVERAMENGGKGLLGLLEGAGLPK